ncbi:hypothetical protein QFC19_002326 [Naganishia cerealis]|uniref:Uncharacterized protein n=1 Tax=Naganishia cerealis TaxID=610337 RepID=A0ACC2WA32_9TREE|nr:hypothetical protein QFC19_002326 [Naganishia cerealis]
MASPHPERDAAIDQLCAITATETPMGRRSIEQVLRSTEWNVEECPDGYLPDFWRQGGDEDAPKGTYKEFLDHLKAERKVGCVVLCCSDHEDDLEFKRNVLTNEEFVKCLRENDILIWGADVREREGYQVSQTLQATTYPAISFFSLMPVTPSSSSGSSSSTSSNSKFTILTTVQGSPSTTTSTPSLIQLITTTIVPRTRPFLNRLRRERHALEEARRVREEQDRALAETERRDRDKILAIRRANEARARMEREEALRVAEAREIEQREREQREKDLVDIREWRRYAKRYLLRQEPGLEQVKAKQAIRVQIRLPHGAPAVRAFPVHMDTAREVYIWAETLLLDGDGDEDTEARLPAGFSATEYPAAGRGQPHLELFTAYPRKHVSLDAQGWRTVVDAGGSLVMERAPWEQPGGDDSEEEEEG